MKTRKLVPALLCAVLLLGLLVPVTALGAEAGKYTTTSVYIDGKHISMDSPAVIIEDTAYAPITELCMAMGATNVTRNGTAVTVSAPGLRLRAAADDCYIDANGRYLYVPGCCKMIDGELYVPVRQISEAFGAELNWLGEQNIVAIASGSGAIVSAESFYGETDLLWMSRIISAEARGESMLGKIAVGNVIMNRIASPQFPDTVYDVIFDKRCGIQFTPAYSGAIYCSPAEDCIVAAKLALDGADVIGDSLYFSMSSTKSWASRNKEFIATIGNHNFYA